MRAYDIINKKKHGHELDNNEISYMVKGFSDDIIPDYQMSAFLMAIYFKGMSPKETANLTMAMVSTGDVISFPEINKKIVDKHSTGGVGDKTSLVLSPIVASLGLPVAKMSGRGLGHTGGTIDKLESIPGLRTAFSREEFMGIVAQHGICIAGQSANLAPADKKIYALRDATATVDSIGLIASSIMSKKLASGAGAIVLDVKTGSGAFMKTVPESVSLAKAMIDIGVMAGVDTMAIITNMDKPLGNAIGNSLEIIEVINTLKGKGPADLLELSLEIASLMLVMGEKGDYDKCRLMAINSINDGSAFEKFKEMVVAQGGDGKYIDDPSLFEKATIIHKVKSLKAGFIQKMDAEMCGVASVCLGAGRETVKGIIDHSAGIELLLKTGDFVNIGDDLAVIHTQTKEKLGLGLTMFLDSITIGQEAPEKTPLIYAKCSKEGVNYV